VIILRGAGGNFSSGVDIAERKNSPESVTADDLQLRERAGEMNQVWECPIPVIAEVQGWCVAGATELVFCCDLLFVATDARLGHPGVQTQGTPPMNMWLYFCGPQLAKWLMLSGATISGTEAAEQGIALSSHDAGELDDVVMGAAEKLARNDRDVLIANKAVLNYGLELLGRSQLHRFASAQNAVAHASPGNQAFRSRVEEVGLASAVAERNERMGVAYR
jgi:enoyl-CoA hydratase